MPEIVEFPGLKAFSRHALVSPYKLGAFIEESYRNIDENMRESGLKASGVHYTRYGLYTPFLISAEVGIQIQQPLEPEHGTPMGIKITELPAGRMATEWHEGPYEDLPFTYKDLWFWIRSQRLWPGKLWFEEYHTNPDKEPDKAQYKTKVFMSVSDTFVGSFHL